MAKYIHRDNESVAFPTTVCYCNISFCAAREVSSDLFNRIKAIIQGCSSGPDRLAAYRSITVNDTGDMSAALLMSGHVCSMFYDLLNVFAWSLLEVDPFMIRTRIQCGTGYDATSCLLAADLCHHREMCMFDGLVGSWPVTPTMGSSALRALMGRVLKRAIDDIKAHDGKILGSCSYNRLSIWVR